MRKLLGVVVAILCVVGLAALAMGVVVARGGFTARAKASKVEAELAETLRDLATPRAAKRAANPVPATAEAIAAGRRHFAAECALCHGNDGKGSALGKSLFPPVPDLKDDQGDLTDGEIFHVIENGIRFSGMPAFGDPKDAEEAREHWEVVRFIRHLPQLTPAELEEMKRLNPRSFEALEPAGEHETSEGGGRDAAAKARRK